MAGRLEGKVAIVTGGASGIGEGTIRRFIEEGAKCIIADIQTELAKSLADDLGGDAVPFSLDVADEDQVKACVDFAVKEFGSLDVMFNNAGILGSVGPIGDIERDGWLRTIDVLLSSVFYGIKHAARVMQDQGYGSFDCRCTCRFRAACLYSCETRCGGLVTVCSNRTGTSWYKS